VRPLVAGSQCERLLAHLARGKTITSYEAFRRYGITSLHRRLAELRERGHQIDYGTPFKSREGVKANKYRLQQ